MPSSTSQSLSKYHVLFNNEKSFAETETKLYFIWSIWDYDHIMRLYENNLQYLWCIKKFQGINATKALDHVLGKKGIYIKICYESMGKYHITRYQYLQNFKQDWKGVLHDDSENIKALISSLQKKSSAAIESTIHHSYKIIPSSNYTIIYEI